MTSDALERARSVAQALVDRERRAADRLALDPTPRWCLALLGFRYQGTQISWRGGVAALRRVEEPPGELALPRSLRRSSLFGLIGALTSGVEWELCVQRGVTEEEDNDHLHVAHLIISGIRIVSLSDFVVSVLADHSWSMIGGIHDNSVRAAVVEQPVEGPRPPERMVTETHLAWVESHLADIGTLMDDERFSLAVDLSNIHRHQSRVRIGATALWTGIEALFPVTTELRFRLSLYVSALLHPQPGKDRHEAFRRIRALYDTRSKIVHGAATDEAHLISHVEEVRDILGAVLRRIVERKALPTQDELDALLLGSPTG